MRFINLSEHERTLPHFQHIASRGEDPLEPNEKMEVEALEADIKLLNFIYSEYKDALSQVQQLAEKYYLVLNRTRVQVRKEQIRQSRLKKASRT